MKGQGGPASGGAKGGEQAAGGIAMGPQPASGGEKQVASGLPRWRCSETGPKDSTLYHWKYTKAAAGARVEMQSGDWNKERFEAEVQAHDTIMSHVAMRNKLKNTRADQHECDTNFHLHLDGICFATVGYSRNGDPPGRTHCWVQVGAVCSRNPERKAVAVEVMLNCMGFKYEPGGATRGWAVGDTNFSRPWYHQRGL